MANGVEDVIFASFEGHPFARAENIDIQSRVLLHPFWTQNPTRNGREIAIRPTKERAD